MRTTRQQRINVDIMIGDRFFATFRGNVNTTPVMAPDGRCEWLTDLEAINAAILERYPSFANKKYQIYNN